MYRNIAGHQVIPPLFRLMVKMLGNLSLGLQKALGLKTFVQQELCLQLLLHVHVHAFYRRG